MRKITKVLVAAAFFLASLVVVGKEASASTGISKQSDQLVLKHANTHTLSSNGYWSDAGNHGSHGSHGSHVSSSW